MLEVLGVFDKNLVEFPRHNMVAYLFTLVEGERGWQQYTNILKAEWSTIEAIGLVADESTSTQFMNKPNYGKFIWGNITFKLGGAVELRPEERVTFEPRGIVDAGSPGEPVTFAPAP
jgi:hypothetical protein